MVSNRWDQWYVRRLKPLQNGPFETPPHRIQLLVTEASHLTRDHVASTHNKIRLKGNQLIEPLINSSYGSTSYIPAVEVADQPNPENSPLGGVQGQGRCSETGAKHQLQHPATT